MQRGDRLLPLILTSGMVGLIVLSVAMAQSYLAAVVVVAILVMVAVFRLVFRSSRAFLLTLANLIAVYACLFVFFLESNFSDASASVLAVGFALPLAAFVAGSLRHRKPLRAAAVADLRDERRVAHIVGWLGPVLAIGIASFVVPRTPLSGPAIDAVLLAAMVAISLIVFALSRDISAFLLETGLLFDEFFRRSARLAVPAFAFLTFYSLLVILFAALYAVLDRALGGVDFRIDGALRAITFPEALYFSLMTLSTVGYGDISPASSVIRLVAGAEIVCGILLLLFGFNEIFSFARSQELLDRGHRSERGRSRSPSREESTRAKRNSPRGARDHQK